MTKKAKNKKKAFTLIELMAVVIILGVISTITVTSINYTIENSKQKLYVEQISRLKSSVKEWSVNNVTLLPTNNTAIAFLSIDKLKDVGVITTDNVIDPRNNEQLNGCMTINYDETYNQYVYNYLDADCSSVSDAYKPVITVTGGQSQFVEVNTTFVMPTASAKDYTGRDLLVTGPIIKKGSQIVTSIDTSNIGDQYTLTYSSVDENLDLVKNQVVTITVNDTIAPIICVNGNCDSASVTIEAAQTFIAPVATVTDNSCGISGTDTTKNNCDQTLLTHPSGSINPAVEAVYNITYTATDSSDNSDSLVVTISVQDTVAPTLPTYAINLNTSAGATYNQGWTNQNVWLGSFASTDNGTGIANYQYSTDCSTSWTNISPTTYNTTTNTSFCLRAIDKANNPSTITARMYVKIDKVVPTCASSGSNAAWTNGSRTLTGTCSDTGGSGCVSTTITKNYSTETNSTTETPGAYNFTDAAGNVGSGTCPATQTVHIDKTNPSCSGSSGGNAAWTNGSRVITSICSDTGGSGCTATTFSTTYSTQQDTSVSAGTGTLTDNAGNSASSTCPATAQVRIDKTFPTCAVSGGVGTWTNQTVTLTGTCSDTGGSGCTAATVSTPYASDTNNASATTGNISDTAGNVTACATQSVYVDKTAPTAPTANLNGYASGAWTNGNVTTTLSSTDGSSGVASYTYSHDNVNFSAWPANPWAITWDGQWTFYARATDAVGNVSASSSPWVLRIDKTAPTITTVSCPKCGAWVNAASPTLTVSWTATDGGIGISQMQYTINQSTVYTDTSQPSGNPTSFSTSDTWGGQYNNVPFYLRAIDALGQVGPWMYVGGNMYRDTVAPTFTLSYTITSTVNCRVYATVSSAAGGTSGLPAAYISWNGSAYASGTVSPTYGMIGTNAQITARIRDGAGNTLSKTVPASSTWCTG